MSNESLLNVSDDQRLGKVEIAPEVIETIAGLAASEIEGVASMRGSFASDVVEKFGGVSHSKGVKVDISETAIEIDMSIVIQYGVSIPKVSRQLQTNIRQSLKNMTALEVNQINIHVVGIQMETEEDGHSD